MTIHDLLRLWRMRDARYRDRHALSAESRAAVKAWRLLEIDALPPEERKVALVELGWW